LHDSTPEDPKAKLRRVIDAFTEIGVSPEMLEQYLGHTLDSSSPAEIEDLRTMYKNIRAGETTFHQELDTILEVRENTKPKKTTLEAIAEKVNGEKNAG